MALQVDIIKHQMQSCMAQRDRAFETYQQCVGAISILQEQLNVIMGEELQKVEEQRAALLKEGVQPNPEDVNDAATMDGLPCEGELKDGEVEQQEQVEAPQG